MAVDLALVDVHPGRGADPEVDDVTRVRCFLNTASLGSYPDLVRLREQWQPRWGKWPAFAAALVVVLRKAEPVAVKIDGELALGVVPVRRQRPLPPARDGPGLAADPGLRACSTCAGCAPTCGSPGCARWPALLLGAFGHSRVYGEREVPELDVELAVPGMLATDGEVVEQAGRYTFRVAKDAIPVYRRDERQWIGRDRPFVG